GVLVVDPRLHLGAPGGGETGLEVGQVLRGRHADLVPLLLVPEVFLRELAGDAPGVDALAARPDVGDRLANLEGDVRQQLPVVQLGLRARDARRRVLAVGEGVRERHLDLYPDRVSVEVVRHHPVVGVGHGAGERGRWRDARDVAEKSLIGRKGYAVPTGEVR